MLSWNGLFYVADDPGRFQREEGLKRWFSSKLRRGFAVEPVYVLRALVVEETLSRWRAAGPSAGDGIT